MVAFLQNTVLLSVISISMFQKALILCVLLVTMEPISNAMSFLVVHDLLYRAIDKTSFSVRNYVGAFFTKKRSQIEVNNLGKTEICMALPQQGIVILKAN